MGTGDIWQLDRRKKAETNPRWNKRWLSIIWCFPVARPFHFCRMTIATWTLITCFDELNDSQTFWQRQLSWPGCLMSLNWLPLHMVLSNFIQIHSNLVQILVLQIWAKFEWIWMKFERNLCTFAVCYSINTRLCKPHHPCMTKKIFQTSRNVHPGNILAWLWCISISSIIVNPHAVI